MTCDVTFVSKAAASGATIVADVKSITTQFNAPVFSAQKTLVGGGRYVRMSLATISALGLPTLSYFRSVDRFMPDGSTSTTNGGYWSLWEDEPALEHFGAIPDAVFGSGSKYVSGSDCAQAWDALISYMTVRKTSGRVGPGSFYASRQLQHTAPGVVRGESRDQTLLHVILAASEVGVNVLVSGAGLVDMEVKVEAPAPKGPEGGQLLSNIMVGAGFVVNYDHPEIKDFRLERLRLTRASGYDGFAIFVIGNISGGTVRDIDDLNSSNRSSGMYVSHPGYRGVLNVSAEKSWHPRNVFVDDLRMFNGSIFMMLSSSHDYNIGRIYANGADSLFEFYVGDELDFYTAPEFKGKINKGTTIDEIVFDNLTADSRGAISLTSLGSSVYRYLPAPDNAVRFGDQMDCSLKIGKITGRNTTPADRPLLRTIHWQGELRIDEIDVGDAVRKVVADLDKSRGISIGTIIGAADYSASAGLVITYSDDITVDKVAIQQTDINTNTKRCIFIGGARPTGTLISNAAAGATTVSVTPLVTSGAPLDIPKGTLVQIGGQQVRLAAFYRGGTSTMAIEPLPAAVASGASVVADSFCKNIDLGVYTKGGYTGVFAHSAQVKLRGPGPCDSGHYAYHFEVNAVVDLMQPTPRRNGLLRLTNPTAATREVLASQGARVRIFGGEFGNDSSATIDYNIGTPTADPALDNRLICIGSRFVGAATGRVAAGSQTDFKLYNCTDAVGSLVTT